VVAGQATDDSDGPHDFTVTLHHDDAGEDGEANWWRVETRDFELLGRRELSHPHSQQLFTLWATITVPARVNCGLARGHHQIHGYGDGR
jgi:hypothetical protein